MAGLALGSFLAGHWSDAKRGEGRAASFFLKAYGKLELFIGLWAVLSLLLLGGIETLYFTLAATGLGKWTLRALIFGSAFCVLLPPTCAMGATLPIFTQTLVLKSSDTGEQLSKL